MATIVDQSKILNVYETFKFAAAKCKRYINFPKNTDPTKTYAWRYLQNFVRRCEEQDIEDDLIPEMVNAIVHASNRDGSLARRGIAVLDQRDIISVGIAKLEREAQQEQEGIDEIKRSYAFLLKQKTERNKKTLYDLLIEKQKLGGRANIIRWYESRHIGVGFLALSKSCKDALKYLNEDQRSLLPNDRSLRQIRIKVLMDSDKKRILKNILNKEL